MHDTHDDRIQGILFAAAPAPTQAVQAPQSVLQRVLHLLHTSNSQPLPPTHRIKVAVQFLANDQYIANPGALLGRFRPLGSIQERFLEPIQPQ
jgi:hypothetical protein